MVRAHPAVPDRSFFVAFDLTTRQLFGLPLRCQAAVISSNSAIGANFQPGASFVLINLSGG